MQHTIEPLDGALKPEKFLGRLHSQVDHCLRSVGLKGISRGLILGEVLWFDLHSDPFTRIQDPVPRPSSPLAELIYATLLPLLRRNSSGKPFGLTFTLCPFFISITDGTQIAKAGFVERIDG
jgi:hypothetical protein